MKNKKLFGFTLAEVLITLAIIGVVAALTIPNLVTNYKEKETVTKVKKFYGVFSQAYRIAIAENGPITNWELENAENKNEKFMNIITKYLKNDTINGVEGYLPDGVRISGLWLNLAECNGDKNASCGDIYITTDGKSHKDENGNYRTTTFNFILHPYSIEPQGVKNSDFSYWCLQVKRYPMCTAWVIKNENMDYLHCKNLNIDKDTKCH